MLLQTACEQSVGSYRYPVTSGFVTVVWRAFWKLTSGYSLFESWNIKACNLLLLFFSFKYPPSPEIEAFLPSSAVLVCWRSAVWAQDGQTNILVYLHWKLALSSHWGFSHTAITRIPAQLQKLNPSTCPSCKLYFGNGGPELVRMGI